MLCLIVYRSTGLYFTFSFSCNSLSVITNLEMDTRQVADLLRAIIDPSQQLQAEEQLIQVRANVVLSVVT